MASEARVAAATKPKRKTTKKASPTKRRAAVKPPPSPTGPRRAIFIDVENASSEVDLVRVLESLHMDYTAQPTELTAVGNWRTAAQKVARRLASLGARLVHSAPVTGVRDWSDLWIATAAGVWLGQANAGDRLEIVSDDRAFDAVGDVSLALGVLFSRVPHRAGRVAEPSSAPTEEPTRRSRPRRRRRSSATTTREVAREPAPADDDDGEQAHAAPPTAIHDLMTGLSAGRPGGWVNLDVLENALKASGFARPPGSARLVTRLRKLKDFEVSAHGKVRLSSNS
jgi:hypothetical protein